jgi:hypothetical protein
LNLMKGRTSTVTRSEALQRVLRRESCPYLVDCAAPVTKEYFGRICNSAVYLKCHHFARRVGELKAPMAWLQRFAIDEEKLHAKMGEEGSAVTDVEKTIT